MHLEHVRGRHVDAADLLDDSPVHITTRKPISGNTAR